MTEDNTEFDDEFVDNLAKQATQGGLPLKWLHKLRKAIPGFDDKVSEKRKQEPENIRQLKPRDSGQER